MKIRPTLRIITNGYQDFYRYYYLNKKSNNIRFLEYRDAYLTEKQYFI